MSGSSAEQVVTRWRFAVLLTFALVTAGTALAAPVLVVGGLIPLTYVGYGYLSHSPTPDLAFTRAVSTTTPIPGTAVTVTLTVRNVGETTASDVRLTDGVPGPLPVTDGSARAAVTLLPGESATVEYTLRARRGVYRFDSVRYRARSAPGGHVRTTSCDTDGTVRLRCLEFCDDFPLPRRTRQYVGSSLADTGGEGVEFFGSREHHPTDPASRIDWNRLASTGELTTLIHREERARTVVFLLDASETALVGGGEGTYTGVELGAYAVERGTYALLAENDSVGLAVLGTSVVDHPTFVKPGGSETTLERIRFVLSGIGAFAEDALTETGDPDEPADNGTTEGRDDHATQSSPAEARAAGSAPSLARSDGGTGLTIEDVLARTPRDAQFVVVSPLLGDDALTTLETLAGRDLTATVLSPDVLRGESIGTRLERVERDRRLHAARAAGIPVIDWDAEEPLSQALILGTAPRATSGAAGWSDA